MRIGREIELRCPRCRAIALRSVCPASGMQLLREEADAVVALRLPTYFRGVGDPYLDFRQVSDEEVLDALARPARAAA